MPTALVIALITLLVTQPARANELADSIRHLDTRVLSDNERQRLSDMVVNDIERRRRQAIAGENNAWRKVQGRDDWERFRDARLTALRTSLGELPVAPSDLRVHLTGEISGDGYEIENLVFESRAGLIVTANLYLPFPRRNSMPAVLFSHSHHNPKTQGELQDMGMTWARQGWVVLVMDMLGHGERRQHPFVSRDQYSEAFRVGRQDYYFRYNVGLQLQLVGESLLGWMVGDLMRGVDVLRAREGVDKQRIILIGSVAGGGDPAGVAAAFDPRIAAVAPFNFGGPQPDYAIPQNAEDEFYFFGVGYWESTRCLRLGGRDGFAHWLIVGSVAPRRLIYSHEFSWDSQRDPVWPRLQKVFSLYDARDHLDVATGRGTLQGRPPESTHCNNVGVIHRRQLYPHLQRWYGMQAPTEEFQDRRELEELTCLTSDLSQKLDPQPVHKLAGELATLRVKAARASRQDLSTDARRQELRADWSRLLGHVTPAGNPIVAASHQAMVGGLVIEHVRLDVEDGIVVPLVMLRATSTKPTDARIVIVVSRAGKQRLVEERHEELAEALGGGAAICLPDLRGTGETSSGGSLGPQGTATTLSSRDQVLGQTLLGSRLRDLRSVLKYVRARQDLGGPIALWGDSLAEANPQDRNAAVPHAVENPNVLAEPSGGLLALLGALFEDDVCAVYTRGTLASFQSLLDSPFLYVPHDAVVPGALTIGDVPDLAAAIAPRPLKMVEFVDGVNRRVAPADVEVLLAPTRDAYHRAKAHRQLYLAESDTNNIGSGWLGHVDLRADAGEK